MSLTSIVFEDLLGKITTLLKDRSLNRCKIVATLLHRYQVTTHCTKCIARFYHTINKTKGTYKFILIEKTIFLHITSTILRKKKVM